MTTTRNLGIAAPDNLRTNEPFEVDGMRWIAGEPLRTGDPLAIDMTTGRAIRYRLEPACNAPDCTRRPGHMGPHQAGEAETRDEGLTGTPLGDVATATDPMETRTIVKCEQCAGSVDAHPHLGDIVPRYNRCQPVARGLDALIPTRPESHPTRSATPGELTAIEAEVFPAYTHGTLLAIKREWYEAGRAAAAPVTEPTGPKLGGQRQGGARAATEAAELVAPKAGTQRWRVLQTFVYYLGDGSVSKDVHRTDVDIVWMTGLSANSVRPRRVELVDAGWLEAVPDAYKVHNGRKHTLWTLTPAAREALR